MIWPDGLENDGQGAAGVVELVERGHRQGLGAGIQVGHRADVGHGAAVALFAHVVVAIAVVEALVLVEIEAALVADVVQALLLAQGDVGHEVQGIVLDTLGGRVLEQAIDRLDAEIIEEDRGPAAAGGVREGDGMVAGSDAEGGRPFPSPLAAAGRAARISRAAFGQFQGRAAVDGNGQSIVVTGRGLAGKEGNVRPAAAEIDGLADAGAGLQ